VSSGPCINAAEWPDHLSFIAPSFLLLSVVALLPWVGPFATTDRRHALIRTVALLAIVFALARPVSHVPDGGTYRVVVLDRSASISDAADQASQAWLSAALDQEEQEETQWTVVELGQEERTPLTLPAGTRHLQINSSESSPLGAALDAASRAIPSGAARAGVALLTDGLATEDLLGSQRVHALADLTARELPVDVLRLEQIEGDLRAVSLQATAPARSGRELTMMARLLGAGQVVRCRLSVDDTVVAEAENIAVDGEVSVPLTFVPDEGGFLNLSLEVEVTGGVDPRAGDLLLEHTLCVDDPMRVLYLGRRMQAGKERLKDLVGGGFEMVERAEDDSLDGVDLVVLDDRPASELSSGMQEDLVQRVQNGAVGLVAAGGEASFGPGGYHEEPIEALLPVEFVQKEEKRDPSTTLVVIIDTSGSMGGNRVQLAKEVSRLAIRRLLPHDKVGMVEFYGAKRWAVPIQPASNSIEIERALNRLDAGGGTVILPAIEEAYYGLKNVRTRYKHVLILTDGGVETGAFEPLLRRMADDGMNVSTVLIGPDAHSEFLVSIANWGQGRFYSVPNRFNLPEILLKQPASAKLPAYRPGIVNVRARGGPAWWGDIDPKSTPPLNGYVETRARPGAERILETAEESHPLLASWRYGLGRVTVLTTEPTGPGTESWADWDGYGELLARALERTAADDAAPFAYELVRDAAGAVVVAEARRITAVEAAGLQPRAARVQGSESRELSLHRVAPDRWEARVSMRAGEGLRVECGVANEAGTPASQRTQRLALDPMAGGSRELQVAPEAADALARAIEPTGGSLRALADVAPGATTLAESSAPTRIRLREHAPFLSLLALLFYLFDLAFRRWPRAVTSIDR
jgi:Ca-activated chloride channel family protein